MTRRRAIRAAVLLALLWALLPEAPARKIGAQDLAPIWLVDHGWHVGLILRREDLDGLPFLDFFDEHTRVAPRYVEIGWGDRDVYRVVETVDDLTIDLAARAALWPTDSVLHVVGFHPAPDGVFQGAPMLRIELDAEGRAALRDAIAETLSAPLEPLGPGLYGTSQFFAAEPGYHLFFTCNQWLSDALNRAGLPSSSLWSTAPIGLFAELEWRGGDRIARRSER